MRQWKLNKTKLLPSNDVSLSSVIANDVSSPGKVAVVSVTPCHQPTDGSKMEIEKSQEDGNEKINEHDEEVATIVASEVADVVMKEYKVKLSTPKEKAYKKLVVVV